MTFPEEDMKPAAKKAAKPTHDSTSKFAERREIINAANINTDVQYKLVTETNDNGKVTTVAKFVSLFNQPNIIKEWRVEDLRSLAVHFGLSGCRTCTKGKFGNKFAKAVAHATKKSQAARLPRDIKQDGNDSDSTTGLVERLSKQTKSCIIRLINILFSDDFRGDFENLGSNKERSVLDSGLAAGDEWFWGNIQEAFCKPDHEDSERFFGTVHVDHYAVKSSKFDPSKFQIHTWQTLRNMYTTLRANYKKCHGRLTASGNGKSDFWLFCDGKVACLYLYHMNVQRGNASLENSMLRTLPAEAAGQTTRDTKPSLTNPATKGASNVGPKKNNKFEYLLDALTKQGFSANSDPTTDAANKAKSALFEEQRSLLAMEKKAAILKAYVESMEAHHLYKRKLVELTRSTGSVVQGDVDHLKKLCKLYENQEQELKEEMEELKKKKD